MGQMEQLLFLLEQTCNGHVRRSDENSPLATHHMADTMNEENIQIYI